MQEVTREFVTARFDCRDYEGQTDDLVLDEHWVQNVYRVNLAEVRNRVVVDLGANIGAVTIWAALAGALAVHAYEPEEQNRERLLHNLDLNGLGGNDSPVTVFAEAVAGDRNGRRIIGTGGGARLWPDDGVDVPSVTLPDVLERARKHDAEIGFLKVDTEGSEYEIFSSLGPPSRQPFFADVRTIAVEFHPATVAKWGSLLGRLAREGSMEILSWPANGGYIWWGRYGR